MRYHHIAVFVTDMERSLRCYRDLLGFVVRFDGPLPDGRATKAEVLDDIFRIEGARTHCVLLQSPDSDDTFLELQQPANPPVQRLGDAEQRYGFSGLSELGLQVEGVDGWFERVRAAGYETQTEYVWTSPGMMRSFIFFDPDGAMVQLCEPFRPLPEVFGTGR